METKAASAAQDVIAIEVDSRLGESVTTVISPTLSESVLRSTRLVYDEADLTSHQLSNVLTAAMEQNAQAQRLAAIIESLAKASAVTGEYVKLKPEFFFCPVLIGSDGKPIPLYEFVETLDGLVDYDRIREELPALSYAQVHGAIAFLRKLAQFNITGQDIDELEDEYLSEDKDLLEELKHALADQEITRVLNPSERDV